MSVVAPIEATGFKEYDLDGLFAPQTLSDMAYKAAQNTRKKFDSRFPGWQLYRRVVAGVDLFDRELEAWAVWMARGLARAERTDGRRVIGPKTRQKPGWIAQAGRDGLDYAIFQKYAEGTKKRAARFGIDHGTYQKIRDAVSGAMMIGLNTFRTELHAEYMRLLFKAKTGNG